MFWILAPEYFLGLVKPQKPSDSSGAASRNPPGSNHYPVNGTTLRSCLLPASFESALASFNLPLSTAKATPLCSRPKHQPPAPTNLMALKGSSQPRDWHSPQLLRIFVCLPVHGNPPHSLRNEPPLCLQIRGIHFSETCTPVLAVELMYVSSHSWFIITKPLSFSYSWYICCLGDQLARRTFSQELADLKGPGMISSSDYSALTFPVLNGYNTLNSKNYHLLDFVQNHCTFAVVFFWRKYCL